MFSPRNKIKLIIVGDNYTGKTSIISKYFNNNYKNDTKIEYYTKIVNNIKVDTWDIKGNGSFRRISETYIQDANAFILLFDITDKSSFINLAIWIDIINNNIKIRNNNYYPILLLGNKSDLSTERRVLFSEAKKFAKDNKLLYLEISIYDEHRIISCIDTYVTNVYNFIYNDQKDITNMIFIDKDNNKIMTSSKSIEEISIENDNYKKKQKCCNYLCFIL
jgi:small GTP-binding protein